jgi:hypothetical protein
MFSTEHSNQPVSDAVKLRAETEIESWWNNLPTQITYQWLCNLKLDVSFSSSLWERLPDEMKQIIIEDWAKLIAYYGH